MLELHTCIGYGGAKDWGSMAPDTGCVQCDYHRKGDVFEEISITKQEIEF